MLNGRGEMLPPARRVLPGEEECSMARRVLAGEEYSLGKRGARHSAPWGGGVLPGGRVRRLSWVLEKDSSCLPLA